MIALGRAMLALLFLAAIWLDHSQPAQSPAETYALLATYLLFATLLAAVTWRSWWLDARLAGPAHFVDIAVFTAIVFSTNGYTSPFFLFFILPLLSAAIRWGWRETALTATGLILLYLAAGLLVSGSEVFELQRFIARSAHLLILSALLIWFGVHQQVARLFVPVDELDRGGAAQDDPLVRALGVAMAASRARSGALLLSAADEDRYAGVCISGREARTIRSEHPPVLDGNPGVLLFALGANRSLRKRPNGWFRFGRADKVLPVNSLSELGADEGVISEVRTGTDAGWLVLWDVPELSTDYLELGTELGRAAGAVLDRDALLSAIEEGAAVRTRLSLARDVHDSLVQFLAGAAFRVEAISRAARSGEQVESQLKELKRLLIDEQAEIRTFVSALRRDHEVALAEAVEELKLLARRLESQWDVECRIHASPDHVVLPLRLQLDLQQLLREAVANAVRHGRADCIEVGLSVEDEQLLLKVTDNGTGFLAANGESRVEPWSLRERVDRAHGSLTLTSEPGRTDVLIVLPLSGAAA